MYKNRSASFYTCGPLGLLRIFSAFMISFTVLAVNLLGDGLCDALDARMKD